MYFLANVFALRLLVFPLLQFLLPQPTPTTVPLGSCQQLLSIQESRKRNKSSQSDQMSRPAVFKRQKFSAYILSHCFVSVALYQEQRIDIFPSSVPGFKETVGILHIA